MSAQPSTGGQPHSLSDTCPWCEQPIPHEKFAEIHHRIQANERAQTRAIERRLTEEHEVKLAEAKAIADAQVAAVHEEAARAIESAAKVAREEAKKLAAAEYAVKAKAIEEAKASLEKQLAEQTAREQATLAAQLAEQREVLERHHAQVISADKAEAFKERQKLEGQLDHLKRQLQRKTAEELGEGAEIDLFEALKREFPKDDIQRVKKGESGADIVHYVREGGRTCGCIVYDSKNRSAWRTDYVTKLRNDQIAAKADHAILASRAFPTGTSQLHMQNGVIIANPARAVTLTALIRKHLVLLSTVRVSDQARTEKMAELYDFITSDRFGQLLTQVETIAADLLDLDVKEKKAHDATWKRRGELVRGVEQAQATLVTEIDLIVTAPVVTLREAT